MTTRRTFLGLAAALAAVPAAARAAATVKETIAFIGSGRVATTLGKEWAALGHTVVFGSRTPADAKVKALVADVGGGARAMSQKDALAAAPIVVLSVPGRLVKEVAPTLGDFSGKILMDPTNTVAFADNFVQPVDGPGTAEWLQATFPNAKVVKAFNTLAVSVMKDPEIGGARVTIPLAGNDKATKDRIAPLVSGIGLHPLDVGPIVAARYLEEMERLSIGFSRTNPGKSMDFYLNVRG